MLALLLIPVFVAFTLFGQYLYLESPETAVGAIFGLAATILAFLIARRIEARKKEKKSNEKNTGDTTNP